MQHDANLIGRKIARLRYQKGWTQDTLVAKLQILQCNITRDILASIEVRHSVATDMRAVVSVARRAIMTMTVFRTHGHFSIVIEPARHSKR